MCELKKLMKKSNKAEAIRLLRKHRAKVDQRDMDIYQWLRYAADLTDKYVGPETQLREGWNTLINYDVPNHRQRATNLIDQCIESIEDNGVYRPENKNFLMTLSNEALITLIIGVLLSSIAGSWYLGLGYNQFRVDKLNETNLRLESEIRQSVRLNRFTAQKLDSCQRSSKELDSKAALTVPASSTK